MLGLWYLAPLSTIFQLYRAVSFVGEGNRSSWRNHRPAESLAQIVSHNVVSNTTRHESEFTTLVVIGTDGIGICKSLYSMQLML